MDEGKLICGFCGEEINRNSDAVFHEKEKGEDFHNECRNFLEIIKENPERVFKALAKLHPGYLMGKGEKKC